MSVRVVARIRPLLKTERELDVIVRTGASGSSSTTQPPVHDTQTTGKKVKGGKNTTGSLHDRENIVRIPNPKNEGEEYSFQFNAVYDEGATQQELFDGEVAPTIKHLFNGFDVTIFAYGVTGTGKTHTMRGGKSLADRGVIPRLLSGIYRRSRKIEKDSQGATNVQVVMSYYEIYNDKVFDLFEPLEKRTPAGLPLRDAGGKTVVVGLTERPCTSLKEFEILYDQANTNRSTSATKLNAHSSRSHAILCVKLIITTGEQTRVSTVSAIDLAGSEDNRRTENNKERMVESASINKSLFVLAQCVEAISKKQNRIPYRESKMTRILSLGQNNGLTLMVLNLAPIRSYHLDTLSSLNFANRTKRIEVREVENEPMFKGPPRPSALAGISMQRQPLRPLTASVNANIALPAANATGKPGTEKPAKAFSVYSDKAQPRTSMLAKRADPAAKRSSPLKRGSDASNLPGLRPSKTMRNHTGTSVSQGLTGISAAKIEEIVEKKVEEVLAARALNDSERHQQASAELNEQVQRRLEVLEQRIEGTEDARAEGLSFLLMGKQHQSRGEDSSALKMYELALPFFPNNGKLASKIAALKEKTKPKEQSWGSPIGQENVIPSHREINPRKRMRYENDDEYQIPEADEQFSEEELYPDSRPATRTRRVRPLVKRPLKQALSQPSLATWSGSGNDSIAASAFQQAPAHPSNSPRTAHILSIVNSREISQIKLLRGVGVKKAEAIVDCLCEMDNLNNNLDMENDGAGVRLNSLAELGKMKGVGMRTVENMRYGIEV
ncbi:hypothetical protein AJ80_01738 [Polytolypa hystricis UAMH7299]|uniref:Kinesin motor domain-containing protein n=1 Tax=Polytolypa hystricis (strain UAMH7299) TaxID=1447883 RepID=A0A2B7Z042_POLH7|nr:hypothetical protein AJ80_01738 [Polytolypa hystricis UAMH7299]